MEGIDIDNERERAHKEALEEAKRIKWRDEVPIMKFAIFPSIDVWSKDEPWYWEVSIRREEIE